MTKEEFLQRLRLLVREAAADGDLNKMSSVSSWLSDASEEIDEAIAEALQEPWT